MVLRAALIAFALEALLPSPASAHGWYDKDCCHDQDCEPVPANVEVLAIEDGAYEVRATDTYPTHEIVPKERVHSSHDARLHWCRSRHTRPSIICLYVLMSF